MGGGGGPNLQRGEHQTEKSAVLWKKVVIPFPSVLGLELDERKITLLE